MSTARQTAKTLLKYDGLLGLLKFFSPVQRFKTGGKKQTFLMIPHWYNKNFGMRSVNKIKHSPFHKGTWRG